MKELKTLVQIGQELERSPETYAALAAEWLKVRGRDGRMVPLEANAAQLEFERRCGRKNIVLKARQMGMTTWVAGRFFLRTITRPGTLTLLVAHTRESAESIFAIVQRMWEWLPEDLCAGPLQRSRANVGQMVFAKIGSEFRVASASEANAGRGLSVQNLHCSEVAHWPGDAAATLAGLRAALAPQGEMVLESTPNGAYGPFYEEWLGATEGRGLSHPNEPRPLAGDPDIAQGPEGAEVQHSGLVRHFLPWWMEPAYVGPLVSVAAMNEAELLLVGRHGLSGEQIGFRRGLEKSYGVLRAQEFAEDAESCFRATGACCFEVASIERRMAELQEPCTTRRGGALQVWLQPAAVREYLVAVDTAGGGAEGDFAAVQVIDRATGMQCAELQQRLRPAELARVAAELAREYNGAEIAVERNNHGAAVLAYLETSERYGRLYRDRGEAGWLTTAASKPEIIARLGTLLEQTPERFKSRRLLAECRTFVSGERGRTGAASGAHDDLVMAMAVAQAVRGDARCKMRDAVELPLGGYVRHDA